MAETIEAPDPHQPWIDPQTGKPTMYFFSLMEELITGDSTNSIGTVLSGIRTAQAEVNGITEGAGEEASADLMADFTVTVDPTSVYKEGVGPGITTDAVTVSISGGTPPYNVSYESVGLAPFTATGPSSLGADGDISVFWARDVSDLTFYSGQEKITVTDSAGSPLMAEVVVPVSMLDPAIFNTDGIGAF